MIRKTIENKIYSFVPNDNWNENIEKIETISINDVFETYSAKLNTNGKLLVCNDKTKLGTFCKKIETEEYEEYLETIDKYDIKKDQWVYNILDGISEKDKILFRDDYILIIPDYKWNGKDINKLHILTMPLDKSLRSIRSLNSSHIELLTYCKKKTCEIIKSTYGIDSSLLKMYFHYSPSTYHLHIHFAHILDIDANSSVEYSHDLSSVIFNLNILSDYYKYPMNKRI